MQYPRRSLRGEACQPRRRCETRATAPAVLRAFNSPLQLKKEAGPTLAVRDPAALILSPQADLSDVLKHFRVFQRVCKSHHIRGSNGKVSSTNHDLSSEPRVSHFFVHVSIKSPHHKLVGLSHPQQQSLVQPARIVLTGNSNTQTRVSNGKVNVISGAHECRCPAHSHYDGSLFVGILGEVLGRHSNSM